MTETIIPDKSNLVNDQNEIMQKAVLNEIDDTRAKLNALIDVVRTQDGDRFAMVLSELISAEESLQEAYSSAEDPDYTKRIFGLDLAEYAKSMAFGVGHKEVA